VSVGTLSEGWRRPLPGGQPGSHAWPLRGSVAAVAALTALAAALRFAGLGHQGFWFDEGNTALLVHLHPGKMLGLIPQSESTPPLYYCVAWVWARLFGYGEAGLRSLSALAGVATVPIAYAAARRLVSERVGVVAAALTACNPFLIWYSQEARSYSLLVLLSAIALLAFAYARVKPTTRALTTWVIASGLALATHYYAVLAIAPEAVWLLAVHRRRGAVQAAVSAIALCGLALLPLALSQNATSNGGWIAAAPLGERLGQLLPQFVIGTGAPAYRVLEPLASAIVGIGLLLLMTRSEPAQRRSSLLLAALALGGLGLNLLLVAAGIDDLITRNVIALWLLAAVVVAGGFGAARAGPLGICAAVVLCATGIAAAVGVATDRKLERPDWRAVQRVLGAQPAPGAPARAILIQHYRDRLPLSLYMPALRFWPGGQRERVDQLDVIAISAPQERLCWWGAACNLLPSRLQRSYPIPGFHEAWRRQALQFTLLALVSRRPVVLDRQEVARALTSTTLFHDGLLIQR
jgi:mannosyltransferase